jgi:hypothetical protein
MVTGMIMLGHVLMRRIIAAKRYAASLAGTQVHPLLVMFNTFLANVVIAEFYSFYSKKVSAKFLIGHIVKIGKLKCDLKYFLNRNRGAIGYKE